MARVRGELVGPATVVRADQMLDVEAGGTVQQAVVVIRGDRILYAGPGDGVEPDVDDTLIDCGDRVLMPGLIDAHVHFFGVDTLQIHRLFTDPEPYRVLRAARDAAVLLDSGFTAVRCLGSSVGTYLARAVADGVVRGPSIVAAGQFICSTNGTWDEVRLPREVMERLDMYADSEAQCRAIVRRRIRSGAGVIKVGLSAGAVEDHFRSWSDHPKNQTVGYTVDELKALVDEAHRSRVKVSAHAIGEDAVRTAISAGVDVIEHAHGIGPETADLLAETRTVVVPTLTHMVLMAETGGAGGMPAELVSMASAHSEAQFQSLSQLLQAGVTIASGSDLIGPPWAPLSRGWMEPDLLVKGGMPEKDAVRAVTLTNAAVLGMQAEIGALTEGRRADVIATEGNPFKDISALQRVSMVIKGGVVEKPLASVGDRSQQGAQH